jgi:hypothetical protein
MRENRHDWMDGGVVAATLLVRNRFAGSTQILRFDGSFIRTGYQIASKGHITERLASDMLAISREVFQRQYGVTICASGCHTAVLARPTWPAVRIL